MNTSEIEPCHICKKIPQMELDVADQCVVIRCKHCINPQMIKEKNTLMVSEKWNKLQRKSVKVDFRRLKLFYKERYSRGRKD